VDIFEYLGGSLIQVRLIIRVVLDFSLRVNQFSNVDTSSFGVLSNEIGQLL